MNPALMLLMRAGATAATGIADTFNRADSTTSLGVSSGGQTWTAGAGTWGINGNLAYCTTGAAIHWASVPGYADAEVSATISGYAQFPGLCARVGATGRYYAYWNPGSLEWQLRRFISSETGLASASGTTPTVPVVMTLRVWESAGGTEIRVLVDGVQKLTYRDTTAGRPDGIGVGLFTRLGTASAGRWDSFAATAIV